MRSVIHLRDFFSTALWRESLSDIPPIRRFFFGLLRMILLTAREFHEGLFSLRAMSLVYTTLLSLVPLLAVVFSTLKAFGYHNRLEPLLAELLTPLGERGVVVTGQIISFIDNLKVGVLGAVGILAFFVSVLSLMEKIEGAINHIWHVKELRSLPRRFADYLSVIVVGPLLLFSSLGALATVKRHALVQYMLAIDPWGRLIALITQYIPYVGISLAFAFLYIFITNTKVRFLSALVGGMAGGLLWLFSGWVFASFVASTARYDVIYSSFASLILFFLWLYVAWTIILVGAEVAFFHQNPQALTLRRSRHFRLPAAQEYLALAVMAQVAEAYLKGEKPVTTWQITERLQLPEPEIRSVIEAQQRAGHLETTAHQPPGLVPAVSPEKLSLLRILQVTRSGDDPVPTPKIPKSGNDVDRSVTQVLTDVEGAIAASVGERTLRDLVEDGVVETSLQTDSSA